MIEEHNNACFIVRDATGQALGYFYFEDEPGQAIDQSREIIAVAETLKSRLGRSSLGTFGVVGHDTSLQLSHTLILGVIGDGIEAQKVHFV
jgi:hypothetical protein